VQKWTSSPSLRSPDQRTGVWGWCKINLFSSVGNTILTVLGLMILWWTIPPFLQWAVFNANWAGDSRDVCDAFAADGCNGACWVFIKVRLPMFMYGFYPDVERWRVNLTMIVLVLGLWPVLAATAMRRPIWQILLGGLGTALVLYLFGVTAALFVAAYCFLPFLFAWISSQITGFAAGISGRDIFLKAVAAAGGAVIGYLGGITWIGEGHGGVVAFVAALLILLMFFVRSLTVFAWRWIFLLTIFPLFSFYMLIGSVFGLPHVETHYWGGFFLTLVVAASGMATSLPIGILMALGRRSDLPVIKAVCVSFIELARGVPLVSVLFMASVMFPLFLPESVTFDKLLRALVGIAFFYAAYMAEVIRGGLQAIPKGQYEAAKALGWPYWRMMSVIILPQTLRLVIPGLAINFLSLFKDTTLVAVIGLLDLLGIAKAAMADAEWLGFTKEAYVFAGVVFWIFCFAISRYSVHLEKKLHTSFH